MESVRRLPTRALPAMIKALIRAHRIASSTTHITEFITLDLRGDALIVEASKLVFIGDLDLLLRPGLRVRDVELRARTTRNRSPVSPPSGRASSPPSSSSTPRATSRPSTRRARRAIRSTRFVSIEPRVSRVARDGRRVVDAHPRAIDRRARKGFRAPAGASIHPPDDDDASSSASSATTRVGRDGRAFASVETVETRETHLHAAARERRGKRPRGRPRARVVVVVAVEGRLACDASFVDG